MQKAIHCRNALKFIKSNSISMQVNENKNTSSKSDGWSGGVWLRLCSVSINNSYCDSDLGGTGGASAGRSRSFMLKKSG